MKPVLIAGTGNIFFGDDGFGVEVLRRLDTADLPDGVSAVDYGIRGVHLAYDLLGGDVKTLILVDALPMGEAPGTLAVVELDDEALAEITGQSTPLDSHSMNPQAVIAALHAVGGHVDRILVIGCQPATVQPGMGLSPSVAAAVDAAARLAIETATSLIPQPIEKR